MGAEAEAEAEASGEASGEEALDEDMDSPEAIIKSFDTDSDGKLSLGEILGEIPQDEDNAEEMEKSKAAVTKAFQEADADKDDLISLEELPKLIEIMEKEEEL